MVYCTRCGALNADDANVCSNCGSALKAAQETSRQEGGSRTRNPDYARRKGSGVWGILLGGFIMIVIGLSYFLSANFGIEVEWWPMILIIVGVWLLVRTVWWRRR